MEKKYLILFILFQVSYNSFSEAQSNLNIDSCYNWAKANFPLIRQYDLIAQAKEYTISNANKSFLPQISLSASEVYFVNGFPALGPTKESENNNMKFVGFASLNQIIWDGGNTSNQKRIAEAQAEIEKSSNDVQLQAITERINELYFAILLIDEQLTQLKIQSSLLERNQKKAELLNKNGLAFSTDADELKAEILKLDQRKTELQFTRKGYLNMLSLFIGFNLQDSIKLIVPEIKLAPDNFHNRAELRVFDNQQKLISLQNGFDRVRKMPHISLSGTAALLNPAINLGLQEKTFFGFASVSMSWQLSSIYTTNNKILNRIHNNKILNERDAFSMNTDIQSARTNAEIEKYKAILKSDEEITVLRRKIREGYQLQYDNGSCSLYDLINAGEKETEANSNKSLHNIQLILAQYQLMSNNGN